MTDRLTAMGAKFTIQDEATLLERTCDALEAGHAVGWFQGRMEFGPRALGARSILGDPRNPRNAEDAQSEASSIARASAPSRRRS